MDYEISLFAIRLPGELSGYSDNSAGAAQANVTSALWVDLACCAL
jgi:hypothetical protein